MEKTNQEKKTLVWFLVIVTMTVILFIWVFTFKKHINNIKKVDAEIEDKTFQNVQENFGQFMGNFQTTLGDAQNNLSEQMKKAREEKEKQLELNSTTAERLEETIEWEKYIDQKNNLEIDYPSKLAIRTDENTIGFYPKEISGQLNTDISADIIHIDIYNDIKEITIKKWLEKKFALELDYANIKHLTINNIAAIQSDNLPSEKQNIQTFILKNQKLYNIVLIKYSTEDKSYQEIYKKMINSLVLNTPDL